MPPHAVRPAAAASAPSPPRHLERRGFWHFPCGPAAAPPERLSWKKNWKISRRSATSARATRRCPAPSCLQRGFDFLRGPAGGIHHSAQKGGPGRETGTGREMRACAQGAARAGGRRGGGGGAVTVRGQCAHAAASPAIWSLLSAPSRVPITVLSSCRRRRRWERRRAMSEFVCGGVTGGLDHLSAPGPPAPGPAAWAAVGHPGALAPAGEPDARSDHEAKAASFGRGGTGPPCCEAMSSL